jgi:glycosyltransferase involved in cell wall biosynthesis
MEISVIIPVFDEPISMLSLAVKSVEAIFEKPEIIIVLDNKERNISEFTKLDSGNVIILRNGLSQGVSGARNFGISHVSTGFFTFLDADDRFVWTQEQKLNVDQAIDWNAYDIVAFDYSIVTIGKEQNKRSSSLETKSLKPNEMLIYYLTNCHSFGFFPFVWAKFYRTSFILENNISFDESLFVYEDICWLLDCLECAKNIKCYSADIYLKFEDHTLNKIFKRIFFAGDAFCDIFKNRAACEVDNIEVKKASALFFIKRLGQLMQSGHFQEEELVTFAILCLKRPEILNYINGVVVSNERLRALIQKALRDCL